MPRPIGILGGTFDPVHNGHVVLAAVALEQLGLERLLVVPALQSPHKAAHQSAPAADRLELLRLAFAGVPGIEVSDLEIRRPPPSFTTDTIREVLRLHPGRELVLLLGLDALADFPKWRDVPGIVKACRLAVFRRPERDAALIRDVCLAVPDLRVQLLETPSIEISSTLVRERAGAGRTLAGFVPEAVAAEIGRRKLYARR
jgi:nicotinate-nucleotide adenylyltransferase